MITDALFKKLNKTIKESTYPEGIIPVPNKRIEGRAFFPGGDGLYKPKVEIFPEKGIMILGHDFDNECNFEKSRENGCEEDNKTWKNLLEILERNKIPTSKCFFTNAIMGLRKGDTINRGKSKAFSKGEKNNAFLLGCREFFLDQVKYQEPKLIIGLGRHIPKFLSGLPINLTHLSKINKLRDLGNNIEENIKDVVFDTHETKIIFITHPSLYHANVNRRLDDDGKNKYDNGQDFEDELIRKAYERSFEQTK